MRLLCAGKCRDGSEGNLFTCGGCGGETAQPVGDRMSPRSVSCGRSGAVWALQWFGERQGSKLLLTHAHTTCGVGLGVDCVNLQVIHMSIKVCALRSQSLLMLPMLIFPWCACELTTFFKSTSIDTAHYQYQKLLWDWVLCHLVYYMWINKFYSNPKPMTGYWHLLCASITALKHQWLSMSAYIHEREDFNPSLWTFSIPVHPVQGCGTMKVGLE